MNLVEKRRQIGLTCYELADRSGISRTSLSRIEQGKSKIDNFTLGNAKKLADYLNVSLDTLYTMIITIVPTHQVGNKLGSRGLRSQIEKEIKEN